MKGVWLTNEMQAHKKKEREKDKDRKWKDNMTHEERIFKTNQETASTLNWLVSRSVS